MTALIAYVQGIVIGYVDDDAFDQSDLFHPVGKLVEFPATECEVSAINPNHVVVTKHDMFGESSIILSDISITVKEYILPVSKVDCKKMKTDIPSRYDKYLDEDSM